MKRKVKADEQTTYLLVMRNGTKQRVTVPSKWKVTFGPLCPGSKEIQTNGGGSTSLRFYDGTQQKAVFTGVESFRDTSIVIEVEIEKRQSETYYKDTAAGKKQVVVEGCVREWTNPDDPTIPEPPSNTRTLMPAMLEAGDSVGWGPVTAEKQR